MVMETNDGKTNDVGCDQRNTAYLCEKLVKGMIFFLIPWFLPFEGFI